MQLNKLILNNFRQYYGENIIEFASGDKNVTLILGENNAGKTGIYRGIMFALYGDKLLGQDSNNNSDIKLVNMKYLEEIEGLGKASVSIHFTVNNIKYILTRSINALIIDNKYRQNEEDEVLLDCIQDGEYYKNFINGKDDIDGLINEILDSNIKEFFFFDGEHIKTLASSNKEARKEVKKGIIKLMDIDKFEKAKNIIDSLISKEEKSVSKKASNSKIKQLTDKKTLIVSDIKNKRNELETIINNLDETNLEIKELENELKENENLNKIYSDLKELSTNIKNIDERINEKKQNLIKYHFQQLPQILLTDYLNEMKIKLEENLSESSDNIPIHLIENALKTKKCKCCNQDIKSDETIYYLEKLKENFKPKMTTNISNSMSLNIRNSIIYEKENINNIKTILEDLQKNEQLKIELNHRFNNLSSKIDANSESEAVLNAKNTQLNKLKNHVEYFDGKINSLQDDIKNLENSLNELDIQLDKNYKLNNDLDYQIKRLDFLKDLKKTVDEKYNGYIKLTRENLSDETTSIFNKLIDNIDKTLVEKIKIDEDYSMKVLSSKGMNVSEDISQGQQLIVALSFVTALAKIASKSHDIIDYPLFMDTPFAKLSSENRRKLICNIPELTHQWIPLFTDTEFTDFEKGIFDNNNKVGKNYLIKKQTDKISSIEIKGDF